jgi:hypothetical protein
VKNLPSRTRAGTLVLLAALVALPLGAQECETLRYRWSLGGFFGTLARVFLPGHGDGALVTQRPAEGNVEVQLDITAPAAQGDFWRYGAEIDPANGRTLKAWSAYEYRGRKNEKLSELDEEAVIDIASGITLLRRERPTAPRDLRIWNDGKIYPVTIFPRRRVKRRLGDEQVMARHYAVRARRVTGERVWKGKLDIYLADDEVATPVAIAVERKMARVRLLLTEYD